MSTRGQVKIEGNELKSVFFSVGSDASMLYDIVAGDLRGSEDGLKAFLSGRLVRDEWIDGVSSKIDPYNCEYLVIVNLDARSIQEFIGWDSTTGPTKLSKKDNF